MRRPGLVYFSNEAEGQTKLSDICGSSQLRGPLRVGGAFLLLASIEMMEAIQHDGKKLGRSNGRFVPLFRHMAHSHVSYAAAAELTGTVTV